jgi:4'-phosphopantetheinyl transferase
MSDSMTIWPAALGELPALERTVHVWAVPLDDARVDLDGGRDMLSSDERQRVARFHFEQHRRRYLIAHIALHRILSRYLQIDPAQLSFELGGNGKPKLSPVLASAGVDFNLSHSNEMALLAVTHGQELGVDIEYVKPDFKFEEIAERFFTAREVAALRALPSELQRQAFFKCWTCKEAFLKAKGTGLSGELDEVEITRGAADRVRIGAGVPGWSLMELKPIDAYEAAIVVAGGASPVRCYQWEAESQIV